ncbi:MAG: hypothetical protein AAFY59_07255, partial [Pseudomonadota bacterium]
MFTGRLKTQSLSQALKSPLKTLGTTPTLTPAAREELLGAGNRVAEGVVPGGEGGPGREDVPRPDREGSSGFIVIRLEGAGGFFEVDTARTLAEAAKMMSMDALQSVLNEYDLGEGRRLVTAVSPGELREMEAAARQSDFPPLRSLLDYWVVDARAQAEREDEIVKRLQAVPGVDAAYPMAEGTDPAVNPANDPYNAQQGYLDAAPAGIDARWAWTQPSGCGNGMGVVDVERGWRLGHEDFAAKAPTLINGDNRPGSQNHGTAVFGEMIADDNTVGVVGIANAATTVRASSYWDNTTNSSSGYTNAIVAAINALSAGDAIILEIQSTGAIFGAPVEIFDDAFDATRLASGLEYDPPEGAGE